jgi:6-pyruvoyltetrahydropterin/6-carboxytetrahydropterin synthase
MFELTTIVEFEAAHYIPEYPGKCSRLHGHNWQVEVTVCGNKLNKLGMLIDFRDLKAAVTQIVTKLDHYYLNEIEPFCTLNPTAENIARYIFEELAGQPALDGEIAVDCVKVWESPRSAVVYRQEA